MRTRSAPHRPVVLACLPSGWRGWGVAAGGAARGGAARGVGLGRAWGWGAAGGGVERGARARRIIRIMSTIAERGRLTGPLSTRAAGWVDNEQRARVRGRSRSGDRGDWGETTRLFRAPLPACAHLVRRWRAWGRWRAYRLGGYATGRPQARGRPPCPSAAGSDAGAVGGALNIPHLRVGATSENYATGQK